MITSTKIYNKNKEDFILCLACGLAWGLAWGLACGLAWGLALGLECGLALGLAGGLACGLAGGLACGLAGGLAWGLAVILINFKEAIPFISSFYEVGLLILGIIVIAEILFWFFDKSKPTKKENKLWFTFKRKLECIFETLLGLSAITQIYIFTREINLKEYFPIILKWIGYIGLGIILLALVCLVFYIWIKLNELKYKR